MCGIAGLLRFDRSPVEARLLDAMTDSMAHRGPDGRGVWIDGPVGLGHRRLAIRGLTDTAAQPMVTGDVVVSYNGEIYNDRELRPRISAAVSTQFRGDTDTEIIAPGWRAWGEGVFPVLRGMFAIGLWDGAARRLVFARDQVGVKPLYYARTDAFIAFASELKALLEIPGLRAEIDPENLHRMLAQGFCGPSQSYARGIAQVPPGHVVVAEADGRVRLTRYWQPQRGGSIRDMGAAREEFVPLWRETIDEMLVSDRPLGVLLSGGIDSSLIATELAGRQDIPAFTAQFAEESHDESPLAATVAKAANLSHRLVPIDTEQDTEATFRAVVSAFDGQVSDASAIAFYLVCREARREVPVLFSGEGGDEFFGGYPTYRASRTAAMLGPMLPPGLAGCAAAMLERSAAGNEGRPAGADILARFLRGAPHGRQAHPQWRRHLMPNLMPGLYAAPMRDAVKDTDPLADYAAALDLQPGAALVDKMLLSDQSYYLPGDMLLKADAMSMAHGLEVRVPLLDLAIVEFAGRLHSSLLTNWRGPDKLILRTILAERPVGRAIVTGKKKGFQVPVAHLLRTGLKALGDGLLDGNADLLAPWLSADGIRALWRAHQERRANHGFLLWTLLTIATWRSMTHSV